jgi:trk system potassium uptake protein TrkA
MTVHVVVGLGQFGEHVARRLAGAGSDVIAVDADMGRVEALKDVVARAVRADCTSEAAMRAVGAAEAEAAVLALGEADFEAAVLGTSLLAALGVKTVIARSSGPQRGRILTLAGATRVVYPEAEMGEQVANLLLHPSLSAATRLPSGFGLSELRVPAEVGGKTLVELQLRQRHRLTVVAVTRGQEVLEVDPELRLAEGDLVLVAGRVERLEAMARVWDVRR